ncbi:MAG: GatB/YqeY domain-containing protein [Butyrivibrio sp.]|nr:GatB/YqeY domain-containing protein [Butyrivibrio sp.]
MTMIDKVRAEMFEAMKEKDKERKDSLSMLLSALKNKAIDKREDLTQAEEIEVVRREIRQSKETMELAPQDRTDIREQCAVRIKIMSEFVPEEMSAEAIKEFILNELKVLGIEQPAAKDKGKIMKEIMPKLKGKADGGLINQVVGEILA